MEQYELHLSMTADDLNLRAAAAKANTTLQEELEEALRACKRPFLRVSTIYRYIAYRLESLIKKEMDLYEYGQIRGNFLQFAHAGANQW